MILPYLLSVLSPTQIPTMSETFVRNFVQSVCCCGIQIGATTLRFARLAGVAYALIIACLLSQRAPNPQKGGGFTGQVSPSANQGAPAEVLQ